MSSKLPNLGNNQVAVHEVCLCGVFGNFVLYRKMLDPITVYEVYRWDVYLDSFTDRDEAESWIDLLQQNDIPGKINCNCAA